MLQLDGIDLPNYSLEPITENKSIYGQLDAS